MLRAVDEAVGWVLDGGWGNVIVEVNNECDGPGYEHEILRSHRVHELVRRVQGLTRDGRRLPERAGELDAQHADEA